MAESTRGILWAIVIAEDRCGRCGLREGAGHTQYVGQGSRRGRAEGEKQVRGGVISAAANFLHHCHDRPSPANLVRRSYCYNMLNISRLVPQVLRCIHQKPRPFSSFYSLTGYSNLAMRLAYECYVYK